MVPKQVVIVGYDEIVSLDLSGPLEVFTNAVVENSKGNAKPGYQVTVAALGAKTFSSESGLRITADCSLSSVRQVDTLLIPGGRGMRNPATSAKLARWLSERESRIRRIASVCTGVYGLAASGLLNGRRVTTHWKFVDDLAARYPELRVDPKPLYIQEDKFYTSAGVTAGIDLSLALIEEDYGPGVALAVARELVVYMKRPGGQEQFSEPLRFQMMASGRFADLAAWISGHLTHDLSVNALARRMNLCPRQFSRRFTAEFKSSPAAFVQRLRLDEARTRLASTDGSVESVAESVGFNDADSFRRAFLKRFGVQPGQYRGRFTLDRKKRQGRVRHDPVIRLSSEETNRPQGNTLSSGKRKINIL